MTILQEKLTHIAVLKLKSVELDFDMDGDDELSQEEKNKITTEVLESTYEIERYTERGDLIDEDVMEEIAVEEVSDQSGWCVYSLEIDWYNSHFEDLVNGTRLVSDRA